MARLTGIQFGEPSGPEIGVAVRPRCFWPEVPFAFPDAPLYGSEYA